MKRFFSALLCAAALTGTLAVPAAVLRAQIPRFVSV